jgi:lipoate-protein ligase A
MALDRAAQIAKEQGAVPPTLRLYRWARPTVTLGRFQCATDVDTGYAETRGIDISRRFTGGRAVLHHCELTYAIIASREDGIPRGVAASYASLCALLVDAYDRLGVDAELVQSDQVASSAACYLSTTRADLVTNGAKLSGSAQVWLGGTVLQHGSFIRSRDLEHETRLFMLDEPGARRLSDRTVALADILPGDTPDDRTIGDALIAAVRSLTGHSVRSATWSPLEVAIAGEIMRSHALHP